MLNDRLVRWLSRRVSNFGLNSLEGMPIALGTDIGLVRTENQDRVAVMRVNTMSALSQTFVVVAVADGMGGMKDGAECATRTIAAFFNTLIRYRHQPPEERLKVAAETANSMVSEFSGGKGGATLSALVVTADQGVWTVNVGDSRIYAAGPGGLNGLVTRLTVDDSLAEAVGGHGRDLLQFIGMGLGIKPHIRQAPADLDRILITSDGVHFISPDTLSDIFLSTSENATVVSRLLSFVNWQGAHDNATLAVVNLSELLSLLPTVEETGIEVWDAFSGLHVMWLKRDQFEIPAQQVAETVARKDRAPFYRWNDKEEFYRRNDNQPFYGLIDDELDSAELAPWPTSPHILLSVLDIEDPIVDEQVKNKAAVLEKKTTSTPKKKRPVRSPKKPSAKTRGSQLSIEIETSTDQDKDVKNNKKD
jgi:serine/threonine protein phosphatase PrpC